MNGGAGTDLLLVDYSYFFFELGGISTTLDASTTNGKITKGSNSVTFSSIEQFHITGTDYNDALLGGNGNDTLSGSSGSDILTGGAGADTFILYSPVDRIDNITDFVVTDDTISVARDAFGSGLTPNATIRPEQFILGSAAADANDRFIYNQTTGALFFDADGTGATRQVQLASLSTGLAMTYGDIFVR